MKALVGSWDHRPYRLLAENAALRARVAELEAALAAERAEHEEARRALLRDLEVSVDVDVVKLPVSTR